jgi:hypothetical protein
MGVTQEDDLDDAARVEHLHKSDVGNFFTARSCADPARCALKGSADARPAEVGIKGSHCIFGGVIPESSVYNARSVDFEPLQFSGLPAVYVHEFDGSEADTDS